MGVGVGAGVGEGVGAVVGWPFWSIQFAAVLKLPPDGLTHWNDAGAPSLTVTKDRHRRLVRAQIDLLT